MKQWMTVVAAIVCMFLGGRLVQVQQQLDDMEVRAAVGPVPLTYLEVTAGSVVLIEANEKGEWVVMNRLPAPKQMKGRIRIRLEEKK